MEKVQTFTTLEFMYLLLGNFKKHHFLKFRQSELEEDLYYYKEDPKYANLFLDIDCRARKICLSEALSQFTICGGIYSIGLDLDTKYINYDLDLGSIEDLEKKSLVEELACDYIRKKQLAKNSPVSLKIWGIDPNLEYMISRGDCVGSIIEWNLVTDACHISFEQKEAKDLTHILNPIPQRHDRFQKVPVRNAKGMHIFLDHYQFALMQGKINDEIQSAILYTREENIGQLEKMIRYSTLTKKDQNRSVKLLSL